MNTLQIIGICVMAAAVCATVISFVVGRRARKHLEEILDSEYGPKEK